MSEFFKKLKFHEPLQRVQFQFFVICAGVTLFALVLHLNCTALSQSKSSNFFMYIIISVISNMCRLIGVICNMCRLIGIISNMHRVIGVISYMCRLIGAISNICRLRKL